jgi:hypothetical protein
MSRETLRESLFLIRTSIRVIHVFTPPLPKTELRHGSRLRLLAEFFENGISARLIFPDSEIPGKLFLLN